MIKISIITGVLFFIAGISYSQSFEGNYFLGDGKKVSITHDENYYYMNYESDGSKRVLQYEENTPENDQIWLEWLNSKQTGTFVFKNDYTSGIYTDYRTGEQSYIKKRD
jgi:hypothetical protein